MAQMVLEIDQLPMIGRQLFDVITSGMYDNPLMVFREYLQNAVDSIDRGIQIGCLTLEDAQIQITLSGQNRTITIFDNGPGLPNGTAHTILKSLGCSPKEGSSQRGFRGIGRLGGLAYCAELIFETRESKGEKVAVLSWDRSTFESIASDTSRLVSLIETIEKVSTPSFRDATEDEPEHFFKVTLKNVQRFHSDILMNLKVVQDYISQVAPVPYNAETFSFAGQLNEYFSQIEELRCYRISLNNRQVFRPYGDNIQVSTNVFDAIQGVECFTFVGTDSKPIALGWYARTNLMASLPKGLNVRGMRIRQGNIEVGDEHFLEEQFTERRFASWHLGEICIVGNRLKPNARRDGFEHSPDFERFLEQAAFLGRHLSSLCRKSSNSRIARCKVESSLQKLENLFSNPVTYIDKEHYIKTRVQASMLLQQVEKSVNGGMTPELQKRFEALKSKINDNGNSPLFLDHILDGRRLKHYDQKALMKHVAKVVVSSYGKSTSAEDILKDIFTSFTKEAYTRQPSLASLG